MDISHWVDLDVLRLNTELTNRVEYDIMLTLQRKEMRKMLKRFWIHWGNGNISCFRLKSMRQALSIAMEYENVTKVEEVTD